MSVTTTATALCHHHHNSFIIANTTVIVKTETTTIAQRQAQHEQQKQQHINCTRGTSSKKIPFSGIYTLHFRYTTETIFLQDKQYKIWKTTKADSHILFFKWQHTETWVWVFPTHKQTEIRSKRIKYTETKLMEPGLQLLHLSPLPLPPEVGPFGVAGHVVDDGGDGGHDPLVGAAAVKVGLCEDHGQHPLVCLLGWRGGGPEERRLLKLVLREPVTPLQALKKTTPNKDEEGGGEEEGWKRNEEGEEEEEAKNDDSSKLSLMNLSHRYRASKSDREERRRRRRRKRSRRRRMRRMGRRIILLELVLREPVTSLSGV